MYLKKLLKILERIKLDQTRHKVWVAIEVKHVKRDLGGPHEYFGAPKPPSPEVLRYSWGPPRALMRCLTSIATLNRQSDWANSRIFGIDLPPPCRTGQYAKLHS